MKDLFEWCMGHSDTCNCSDCERLIAEGIEDLTNLDRSDWGVQTTPAVRKAIKAWACPVYVFTCAFPDRNVGQGRLLDCGEDLRLLPSEEEGEGLGHVGNQEWR